jgi:tetratricopeptide (TPR) repeat protein
MLRLLALGLCLVPGTARCLAAQDRARTPATETLGTVHFSTSCAPAVAVPFNRAVALLHSFEFGSAIAAFNSVLATDSTCAMAYWGVALSRWGNPFAAGIRGAAQLRPGRDAIERAQRTPSATERERGYITAAAQLYAGFERTDQHTRVVAYERAMNTLVGAQPADTEAVIFYALALAASAQPGDKSYANQRKAASILEGILAQQPNHPGVAHYLIHSHDVPALADGGLDAARRYGTIAPSAPHALHMPSHIYTRVGAWQESIETNLKSIEASLRDGSMGEALHASDYAMYAYLQTGQDRAAQRVLTGLPALAAKFDPTAVASAAPGSAGVFALAAIPARWALERRAWAEAAALEAKSSAFPWTEALTHTARALGAAHTGDLARARASIDSLAAIRARLMQVGETYWADQVEIARLGANAWLLLAQHQDEEALKSMREASAHEDLTEKSAVTPGPLVPARELMGDMLLELKRPAEALEAYRATLEKEPKRFNALYGAARAARLAGDRAAASDYAAQLKTSCKLGDVPGRAELADIRQMR